MTRRWLVVCVWRTEHSDSRVFWRPSQAGYTDVLSEAGRYTDEEALAIAERMNDPAGDRPVLLVPFIAFREEAS